MKRGKRAKEYTVRFKFSQGEGSLPLWKREAMLQRQYHAMANSDDPKMRAKGRELLEATARRLAAATVAALNLKPKTRTLTPENIEAAQRLHKTREAQAKHLGVSKRHLLRELKKLREG
jgi:hypothetical protein